MVERVKTQEASPLKKSQLYTGILFLEKAPKLTVPIARPLCLELCWLGPRVKCHMAARFIKQACGWSQIHETNLVGVNDLLFRGHELQLYPLALSLLYSCCFV